MTSDPIEDRDVFGQQHAVVEPQCRYIAVRVDLRIIGAVLERAFKDVDLMRVEIQLLLP
ncbi:MAG: hypothetical protein RLQ73_21265 [Hoeflea sp. D1-CHI-28]